MPHHIPGIRVFTVALERTVLAQLTHPQTRYDVAYLARECHVSRVVDGPIAAARFESVAARAVEMWARSDGFAHDRVAALVEAWRGLAAHVEVSAVAA